MAALARSVGRHQGRLPAARLAQPGQPGRAPALARPLRCLSGAEPKAAPAPPAHRRRSARGRHTWSTTRPPRRPARWSWRHARRARTHPPRPRRSRSTRPRARSRSPRRAKTTKSGQVLWLRARRLHNLPSHLRVDCAGVRGSAAVLAGVTHPRRRHGRGCTWARTTRGSTTPSTAPAATRSPPRPLAWTPGPSRCRGSPTPTPRTRSGGTVCAELAAKHERYAVREFLAAKDAVGLPTDRDARSSTR